MPVHRPQLPLVSRAAFEERLKEVEGQVSDPRAGVFGPGSKLWEINRHSIIFLAAGRAGLLQVAHPHVAHAIAQHSISLSNPIVRFNRTFAGVFDMVYGDLESSLAAARHVYAVHSSISGRIDEDAGAFSNATPYYANSPEALFWVHATLWDSSVRIFEYFVRVLSDLEKEEYYQETKRFAHLFGIPDAAIPDSWEDFLSYNAEMWASDLLYVGAPAATICKHLLRPPNAALRPIMRWYRGIIAGQLPEHLRDQFGLRWNPTRYERDLRRLRVIVTHLPERLRYLPAYVAAMRRIEGRTERDRIGELLGSVFVGSEAKRDGVR